MSGVIVIENDGPRLTGTNYFESDAAKAGKFYVTSNAGAFRLLVPPGDRTTLKEMASAAGVCVSRGPWPAAGLADAVEVLFDDGTDSPFALHLSVESFDRLPVASDAGRPWAFTAWTRGPDGRPALALELPCRYRLSRRLPDLRPWDAP